jgi:hypothetical protein
LFLYLTGFQGTHVKAVEIPPAPEDHLDGMLAVASDTVKPATTPGFWTSEKHPHLPAGGYDEKARPHEKVIMYIAGGYVD